MGVHTGEWGVVDGVDTVRNWTISESSTIPEYAASNTAGGTGRTRGVGAWTGSYARYGHTPLHNPGELFTFSGYTAPDDDVEGSDGQCYSGTAIVDSVAITWDWATQLVISQVVNFSGHLVLARSIDLFEDLTDPDPPETHGTFFEFGVDVATTPTMLGKLTTATLTLSSANQAYVNSSTYDAGTGRVWTGRKPGRFNWTLAITVQNTLRSELPDIEALLGWRLYTTDTLFWELLWGRVRDYSGITVDRESGVIIQATVNVDMAGAKSGVGLGQVIAPDSSQLWPALAS